MIDHGFPIVVCIQLAEARVGHWVVFYGVRHRPRRIFVSGQVRAGFSREELTWTDRPLLATLWKGTRLWRKTHTHVAKVKARAQSAPVSGEGCHNDCDRSSFTRVS